MSGVSRSGRKGRPGNVYSTRQLSSSCDLTGGSLTKRSDRVIFVNSGLIADSYCVRASLAIYYILSAALLDPSSCQLAQGGLPAILQICTRCRVFNYIRTVHLLGDIECFSLCANKDFHGRKDISIYYY